MAVHDGPGLRTTVFFKGCPLRCRWCHNPEGLSGLPQLMYKETRCRKCGACGVPCSHAVCQPFGRCILACPENCLEIAGKRVAVQTLASELRQSGEVLGDLFGGITFSGGEPLAQPEFLLALMEQLKDFHLCIETSGYAPESVFRRVIQGLDYVIMDLKLADREAHKTYTGVYNDQILRNLEILKESGKPCLIRTPLIPGITDTEANLSAIRALAAGMEWEQLSYNAMAGAKYKMLDMPFPMNE